MVPRFQDGRLSLRLASSGPANLPVHTVRSVGMAMTLLFASSAAGQDADGWNEEKCRLYRHAVEDALEFLGENELRDVFLAQNEAFIATGCLEQGAVCAETEQEIEFANLLTVMTMNEGMASTFVPFGCND